MGNKLRSLSGGRGALVNACPKDVVPSRQKDNLDAQASIFTPHHKKIRSPHKRETDDQ
jgi:hypothetical protein